MHSESRTRSGYSESEIVVTVNAKKLGGFVERLEKIAKIDGQVKTALTPTV